MRNKDDVTEAVHGLDIFTKNWCLNCEETDKHQELTFRCNECVFVTDKQVCLIKRFASSHSHNYAMDNFGSMGGH